MAKPWPELNKNNKERMKQLPGTGTYQPNQVKVQSATRKTLIHTYSQFTKNKKKAKKNKM